MESIYKSVNTIIEMLNDRGIKQPLLDAGQINEFIAKQNNKIGFEIVLGDDIRLVYYLSNKFKWSELKKFFEDETKYKLTIIVVREKITQNNMKQLAAIDMEYQVFLLKELQYNITKHELVPKHELIKDPQDVKNILEQFSLKSKHQLPIILKSDPMAKWLNLKSGDIVKISRPSPTSGHYIAYRCCL